ncbi:MAG TPA: hypothetical protein PLX89_16575 [Verrucomicrobiota bacterium]|nr:hypothetical protein [Verrucomicrobiales bacterium]HRI14612.1 hypothetical protein [Verrucomicrobiota bacterium]
MILLVLRILLTGGFLYFLTLATTDASANLDQDVVNAGRFALAIVIGFAAALTWAPLLGESIAGPVTGLMTDGSVSEDNSWWIRLAKRWEARGWRRGTRWVCFLEGVRQPNLPAAFILGMHNSRPGSWLERAFAREVWRFNNIANCLEAHAILTLRHDEEPSLHPVPEVNLALWANLREPAGEPQIIPVPPAPPPPPLRRNSQIQLFFGAEASANELAEEKG